MLCLCARAVGRHISLGSIHFFLLAIRTRRGRLVPMFRHIVLVSRFVPVLSQIPLYFTFPLYFTPL